MARPRPPLYNKASFVRHLDANRVSWRWYCFDPGTLRLADAHYLLGHLRRFAYFSKSGLPWASRLDLSVNARVGSFVEDAANGALPSVSWIDPAFTNFSPLGFPVNDDHPPADVRDGQDLVLAVYDALASGPNWDSSLLIVVYDEHGGFYDHVPPPSAVDDDPAMFGSYGVRVPAMVVSPWVEPASVTGTLLDHTSIIKTILLRFCPRALDPQPEPAGQAPAVQDGSPQRLGTRVARANHLGELLTRTTPRLPPSRDALLRDAAARDRQASPPDSSRDRPLTELQESILAAARELTRRGHPTGRP